MHAHVYERVPQVDRTRIKLLAPIPSMGITEPMVIQVDENGNDLEGQPLVDFLKEGWMPKTPGAKTRLKEFAGQHGVAIKDRLTLRPGSNAIDDGEAGGDDEPKGEPTNTEGISFD